MLSHIMTSYFRLGQVSPGYASFVTLFHVNSG